MKNTPQYRQEWILEELKKAPLLSYGEMWQKYGSEWHKSERTFARDWEQAQNQLEAYQKKVQKEKEAVSIEIEKEAVKNGLKTKIERLLTLQKHIQHIEQELEKGECEDIKFVKGEPKKMKRPLLPLEKSAMRKNIQELQAEISQIEGDYATAKQEVEIKESKIDYSKVDTETLKALISARK